MVKKEILFIVMVQAHASCTTRLKLLPVPSFVLPEQSPIHVLLLYIMDLLSLTGDKVQYQPPWLARFLAL